MRKIMLLIMTTLLFGLSWTPASAQEQANAPVVHAILFYSPTCPHCHDVINNVLPPLVEKYGDQLVVLGIDVSVESGGLLYNAAVEYYQISTSRRGVPALLVGSTVLVGSVEIPEQFPGIIEAGVAGEGIAWPDEPNIQQLLVQQGYLEAAQAGSAGEPGLNELDSSALEQDAQANQLAAELTAGVPVRDLSAAAKYALDPVGNSIAVLTLAGMLVSVGLCGYAYWAKVKMAAWPEWLIPVLVVIGLGVAGYLAYVETTETAAVCGPVGNCNAVQQSEYARLFGILPIGVLGIVGYLALGAAWGAQKIQDAVWHRRATLAFWGLALAGVLFSIYLTFLEPFVIGATCMWCISSAVVMTLLLWLGTQRVTALPKPKRGHRAKQAHAHA